MYSKGSVDEPVGLKGYLCGAFLPEDHPFYTEKLEVAWATIDSKSKYPKHIHKIADELLILIEGFLKIEIDGDLIELKPRDFLLTKSGSVERTISIEDGTVVIIVKAPSVPSDKYLC